MRIQRPQPSVPFGSSLIEQWAGSAATERIHMRSTFRSLAYSLAVIVIGGQGSSTRGELIDSTRVSARPDAQPQPSPWTPALRTQILDAMRLNRQAFQEDAVLKRYTESRPPRDLAAFVTCDLPRTAGGAPAAQYVPAEARSTPRVYSEAKVVDCLSTTGGLAGTRASPLAQHYYCSLPGLSPDIRGCFTFQLRLPSVSRTRSAWDDGYLVDGTKLAIQKGWKFLGPDPAKVPDVATAFNYCVVDGRPHVLHTLKSKKAVPLDIKRVFPTPTRPMCWVAETQLQVFQGIMSGAINPPLPDQIALLKEYYGCDAIKGKVSTSRFKVLCGFSASAK